MILFPPAKINLGLNVLSKRDDGFHEIKSCMYEIPVCDVLELLPSDSFRFVSSGLPVAGETESNLCVKAFRLMQEKYSIPDTYIHLRKEIPMGAGLGGGSSDAAYVLKGLNTLYHLELSEQELETLAAQLGSDCAFFISGGAQMASGRGEELSPLTLSLKGYYMKLVNPGIHIGTAEAYQNVMFDTNLEGYDGINSGDFSGLINSFESYAFEKYPEIEAIRNQMLKEGAVYAAMSGSGSSVFGLYKDQPSQTTDYAYEKIVQL